MKDYYARLVIGSLGRTCVVSVKIDRSKKTVHVLDLDEFGTYSATNGSDFIWRYLFDEYELLGVPEEWVWLFYGTDGVISYYDVVSDYFSFAANGDFYSPFYSFMLEVSFEQKSVNPHLSRSNTVVSEITLCTFTSVLTGFHTYGLSFMLNNHKYIVDYNWNVYEKEEEYTDFSPAPLSFDDNFVINLFSHGLFISAKTSVDLKSGFIRLNNQTNSD